jgi:hypothetical protein
MLHPSVDAFNNHPQRSTPQHGAMTSSSQAEHVFANSRKNGRPISRQGNGFGSLRL